MLVLIALQQSNTWKDPSTFAKAGPFLVLALIGSIEPLGSTIRDRTTTRRIRRESTIREMLGEKVARIGSLTKIPCADLGASVYKLGRWRPGRRRLLRVARLRLAPQPASNVSWRVGKGVVGLCAQVEADIAIDVFSLHRSITTPEMWDKQTTDITLGLNWNEYERLRGKHGHIIGTPINHPQTGKIVGVVTLDGLPQQSAVLDTTPVRDILREAATACAREL